MTRDRALLVVLDDTQWADPASLLLLLLVHVARSLDGERMLVVVNHRDTGSLPVVLVTDLPRLPATWRLEVRGLPTDAVGRQLAAVLGRELAPADVDRVHARTGGNPYFVGEVGRSLADGRSDASAPAVTGGGDRRAAGRLPAPAGRLYFGDVDAAETASAQALTVGRQCGDGAALAAALRARQLVCSGPDGIAERADIAERMAALGRTVGDRAVALWAHLWRIDVAFQRGDLAAVARELDPLAWCAGEVRGPVARWHLLQCRAVLAQAQARFADARILADQALAALPPTATGHQSAVINRDAVLMAVELHAGGRGSGFATAILDDPGGDGAPVPHVIFTVAAAYQLVVAGRLADAATVYRRPGPPRAWRPIPHARTVCFAFGIRTAIALDLSDDVAALRELLAPYRGQHVVSGAGCVAYNGPVGLHLGAAARHLGLLDDAVTDLEAAARACAGNGAAGFHVEARHELALALAARGAPGDRTRAHALAVDVAEQATALGMAPFVEAATRLRERLDDGRTDPLTPREREVATLVAQGLTNREIAGRLYLSERTAQNHVQHILTKLGLPNRAQIAVWVTARGMSTPAE